MEDKKLKFNIKSKTSFDDIEQLYQDDINNYLDEIQKNFDKKVSNIVINAINKFFGTEDNAFIEVDEITGEFKISIWSKDDSSNFLVFKFNLDNIINKMIDHCKDYKQIDILSIWRKILNQQVNKIDRILEDLK